LPTEDAARLALRTQQIIANETGVTSVADPIGGSFHIEKLTTKSSRSPRLYRPHRRHGRYLAAIEKGFIQGEIQNAAYEFQQSVERGETIVVGVINSAKRKSIRP